jgi:hypothetical protein
VLFIPVHRGKIGGKAIQATRNALIEVFFFFFFFFNNIFNEIKKRRNLILEKETPFKKCQSIEELHDTDVNFNYRGNCNSP